MHWRYRNFWIFFGLALILSLISNGLAEQRVVCYYTNWSVYRPGTAKFTPQNINPYLCTHLIYAFGGFTKENTLKPFDKYQDIEKGGYAKFTGLKTYNKNLKTMLAIGGWNEGSTRFSPMVADSDRRREFVKNSVKFLRQNHFDGLDLDWEYPAFRDGGKPRDKDNYADLVQELREEFERESSKTGRPRLLLSMAIPAGIEYLEKGYDLPRLNEYLDFFNLLSYDYHSAFEPAVNHHAPLYGLEEDNEYNYDSELTIDYTISYLIRHDVSSDKIVLGIPTYGRSYTLFNIDATEIGSPADGPGEEGDATREKGYLAYYEICENIAKSDDWKVVQPNTKAMGPYAFKDNQWVGYDDEDIVKVKASYVNEKKLGGIMFWSIDNDDFRGKCHGRSYPLIEAAKEAMLTENGKTKAKPSGKDGRHRLQADSPRRFRGSTSTVAPTRRRPSSDRFNSRSRSRTSGEQSDKARNDKDRGYARVTTPKSRPRLRPSTRSNRVNGRKKPDTRDDLNKDRALEKSHQTTPEPPTTPDPGTDFKCEDEGFFSHPRDCKKYFWCLDAGPGGLGIVAHQFTCPSGLVFNKLADSCDYPRNVVCPKAKPAGTTTKAPTTTSTVRTTTTPEPDSAEEYEYEDENLYSAEEIEEENTVKSTTAKPLIYKSISRARPTTTTTTTHLTTLSPSTPRQKTPVDILADEEDPRVIKELIELIKKAGGIEQLEKQLHLQDKDTDMLDKDPELITPATISRSLYERVLSRQATAGLADFEATPDPSSATTLKTTTAKIRYLNGPGGAQFAGLDDIPEVQSLRRISKPQYVTIERQRTKAEPEEDIQQDSSDIALSENQAVGQISEHNEDVTKSGPSYVNIRRFRPTTFTNDNDLEETASTPTTSALISESPNGELKQESSPPKSRYTNIARFRSTTKSSTSTMASENPQLKENHDIPETTTPLTIDEKTSDSPLTNPTEFLSSSTSLRTTEPATTTTEPTPTRLITAILPQPTESIIIPSSEIPQTTTSLPNAETTISRSTTVILQPRPFGYPRRTRPSTTVSTTGPGRKVSTRPPNNSREQLDENGLDVRLKSEKTVSTRAPTARRRGTVRFNLVTPTNPTLEVTKRYSPQEETTLYPSRRRNRPSTTTSEAPAPNKRRRRPVAKPDSPIIRIIPTYFDGNTSISSANSTAQSVKITNITISEYKTINDSYSLLTPSALDNNAISEVETTTIREDESNGVLRRKVLLRRRLIGKNVDSSAPNVNTTMRRRKVVRKIRPVTAKPLDSDKYTTDTFTTEENVRTTTIDNEVDDYTTTDVISTTSNLLMSTDNFETVETTTMDYSSLATTPDIAVTTPRRKYKIADVKTPRFVRKKIIRKPVGAILTTQRPINSSSVNRRKHLFVRRRPITTPKPGANFKNLVDNNDTVVSEKMDSTAAASAEKTENITTDMKISKLPTLRELIERYLVDDSENFLEKMISTRIFNNKSSDIIIEPELMDVESNLNENNRIKGDDQTVAESELLRINDGDLISKIGILRSPSHDESKEENSTDEMSVYRSTLGTTRTSGGSTRDRLHTSVKKTAFDEPERRIVTIKARETNDQSGRAQEMAVSVAEAPTSVASIESGRETSSRFRGVQRHQHRVRTKSELPTRTVSPVRRRQRPPAVELTSSRAPRPAILDYDYYDSDDVGLSVRPELKNKIYITRGRIGCLDQGNFAHPTSCKKFITCAKMVNGQVIATEYTCPAKLSFDPVGGICNWSAGLGCKEQSFNS